MSVLLSRARQFTPSTAAPSQPQSLAGPGSSEPQIVLSPTTPSTGHATNGFMFMFIAAVPAPSMSTITVYKRDAASLAWGQLAAFSGTDAGTFLWLTVCKVNPCELYFKTDLLQTGLLEELSG